MAGNKRKVQEINASSMADIAFLLLIFFLVATTMNTDSGINRVLPPWSEDSQETPPEIKERNLMEVKVNRFDQILANKQVVHLSQLTDMVKEFILNPADDENMPEKEVKEIEFIGQYAVSQGVISLQNDRETSYDMYIKVQNELSRAFNEIRDDLAMERFGRKFMDLEEDYRKAVQTAVRSSISEAEPKNIGGE